MGCDFAAKTKPAPKPAAPVKQSAPPKAGSTATPVGPAGGNSIAALPIVQPPLPNPTRDRDVKAAQQAHKQFEAFDVGPLVIDQPSASPPCPGLHACHTVPGPRMALVIDPIDLEGHTWFPLRRATIDAIWKQTWEPQSVPVKWGSIAKGYLTLEKDVDGELYSINGLQALAFSHPALPARAGVTPALAIQIWQGFITGGLSSTTSTTAISASPATVKLLDSHQAANAADLDDLQGLAVGKFTNSVSAGKFDVALEQLTYRVDGVFPGTGSFVLGRQQPLQATANVEASGMTKQELQLDRDANGRISADKQFQQTFKPPGKDDSWSIQLSARLGRGTYDIRGTAQYASKSGEIRGSVTVMLADRCNAWAAVKQRLGSAAPVGAVDESGASMALVGWGVLDFDLSKWLKGSAEVIVDPDGYITTRGRLAPTATYVLFERKEIPKAVLPGAKIDIPRINLIGDFISVDGHFKFEAQGSYGPAVLHGITAEGVYSTNPKIPTEFDVGAAMTAIAQGSLTLEIAGHIRAGLGPVGGVGLRIALKATGILSGYADARPHIARRRVRGADDGSTEWVIYGDLEVAAALDCALEGSIDLTSDLLGFHKDWNLISLSGRTWRIADFGVHMKFDHVIGSKDRTLPRVWLGNERGDVRFNDFKFMNAAVHGRASQRKADQGTEQDTFVDKKVPGALAPAHAPVPGPEDTGAAPPTQAAGPLARATEEPVPARIRVPATGDKLPSVGAPPEEHAGFDMEGVHHDLQLVFDDPPTIFMHSPGDGQLSLKLRVAIKVIADQLDAIAKGSPAPDERTITDLTQEKQALEDLLAACVTVEVNAERLGMHPADALPSHVPGFPELAQQLHAYATMYDRKDLLATQAATADPTIEVVPRPPELPVGQTPRLDELSKKFAKIEPDIAGRYVREHAAYKANGGKQELIRYVEGRAARKLGRTTEPTMIAKFDATYKVSSSKIQFDVLDPENPKPEKQKRTRIPDIYASKFAVGDVKDVAYLSLDEQMQDDFAIAAGGDEVLRGSSPEPANVPPLRMFVIVRDASPFEPRTDISKPLEERIIASGGEVLEWIPDPKVK